MSDDTTRRDSTVWRRHLALIAATLAMILLLLAAWQLKLVLMMVFAAILLAIALRAGANLMARYLPIAPRYGTLITAILAALLVIGAIAAAGPPVAEQFRALIDSLPDALRRIIDAVKQSSLARFIDFEGEGALKTVLPGGNGGSGDAQALLNMLRGTVTAVLGGLGNMVFVVIMAAFLALDPRMYLDGALRLLPLRARDRVAEVLDETGRDLGKWMGGQALDMVIVAALTFVALWALGVPLALVLAVITGLANMVPLVGSVLSAVPAILFALTDGPELAIKVALAYLVIQQIEGNILLPIIQRHAVSLPPAMTLASVIGFGALFGLEGVLLGTPLMVALMVLVRRLYVEDVLGDTGLDEPESRD